MSDSAKIAKHYSQDSIVERLRVALSAFTTTSGTVTPEQLAPLDQFHSRGLLATVEMAKLIQFTPDTTVIDIGSGLGGPSRYLASTYGCKVTGIDLSEDYVKAATYLAERVGLAEMVDYQCANALAIPCKDEQFDVAWTQHVSMNIADRGALYDEAFRVIRPGGHLAVYDVLAGNDEPIHFPVPWSRGPDTSFLLSSTEMRDAVEAAGFRVSSWVDRTELGISWFSTMQQRQIASDVKGPRLGLDLVMGSDFKLMSANLGRNLQEGRAALAEILLIRP